jgi:hypothetical protein
MQVARDEPIEPPDEACDRAVFVACLAELQSWGQSQTDELKALRAENWRLLAKMAARDAPPEVWRPLKPAAADAGTEYENARSWCKLGVIVAEKRGGRWFVRMDSLHSHVAASRGK